MRECAFPRPSEGGQTECSMLSVISTHAKRGEAHARSLLGLAMSRTGLCRRHESFSRLCTRRASCFLSVYGTFRNFEEFVPWASFGSASSAIIRRKLPTIFELDAVICDTTRSCGCAISIPMYQKHCCGSHTHHAAFVYFRLRLGGKG